MKDIEARKEIVDLKKRVLDLELKLSTVERHLEKQTHLNYDVTWDYGVGNVYKYEYLLRDVMKLLLESLGREIYTLPSQEETIVLRIKET